MVYSAEQRGQFAMMKAGKIVPYIYSCFPVIRILTLLLLTPDIYGATYLACVTNTGYIRSLGTIALNKIKTT